MSQIELYPVFGCNPFEARCFVLRIDEFRLLLDCGWNSRFDPKDIEGLKSIDLSTIDAVLLSQPDLLHIGALPYAYAKLGLDAPIFATAPIWRMGQYMLMDAFVSIHQKRSDFDLFTHEDIKKVFKTKFKSKMKYSQEIPLIKEIKSESDQNNTNHKDTTSAKSQQPSNKTMVKRPGNSNTLQRFGDMLNSEVGSRTISLMITPYAAGHMVGGSIWKITSESDNILYAIDYNIRREKHLNESVFGMMEIRPTLLITDCINIGETFIVKRKQREQELYNVCITPLRNGGNVLIPSDSSGRCLELLYSLYSSFSKHKLWNKYHLVFLSHTSHNTLTSAKSMLEWMCDSCQRELNKSQKNVFDFKELLVCQTLDEFKASVKYPYVAIATNEFLECGLSQDLFINLSHHASNKVLLTQRSDAKTLSGKLLQVIATQGDRNVEFVSYHKEKLNEEERIKYLSAKKQKELEEKEKEKQQRESAIAFTAEDSEENGSKMEVDEDGDDNKIPKMDESKKEEEDEEEKKKNSVLNRRIKMSSMYDMYPWPWNDHEQDVVMTDYGLAVDLNEWRSERVKGKSRARVSEDGDGDEYEALNNKSHSLSPSPNDIVNQTMSLVPAALLFPNPSEPEKTVREVKKIYVKCQLKYFNVEGRSDEESIKQTLPTLQPRQIILVHGSQKQKEEFASFCTSEGICREVIIASNLKWHEVKTNTKYKNIIMDDSIERSLDFIKINGYDVAYLNGELQEINRNEMDIDIGDIKKYKNIINDVHYKLTKSNQRNNDEDLDKIRINYPQKDGHCLTYLGDVTKIEMETNLKQKKIAAELYHAGTLVAGRGGQVRVTHKNAQKSKLAIDATLTTDYFKIRDAISNQYHLM